MGESRSRTPAIGEVAPRPAATSGEARPVLESELTLASCIGVRGGDHGAAHAIGSACGMDHAARRTVPCVFPGGEVLPRGSQLQVRAEWNTSHAVLGADVGFMLWVTES